MVQNVALIYYFVSTFKMPAIRIRVQFHESGVQRKCWMHVDLDKMITIEHVRQAFEAKFRVLCSRLILKDAELPGNEDVAVLRDEDLIQ